MASTLLNVKAVFLLLEPDATRRAKLAEHFDAPEAASMAYNLGSSDAILSRPVPPRPRLLPYCVPG